MGVVTEHVETAEDHQLRNRAIVSRIGIQYAESRSYCIQLLGGCFRPESLVSRPRPEGGRQAMDKLAGDLPSDRLKRAVLATVRAGSSRLLMFLALTI
jgi:hypothetical protein